MPFFELINVIATVAMIIASATFLLGLIWPIVINFRLSLLGLFVLTLNAMAAAYLYKINLSFLGYNEIVTKWSREEIDYATIVICAIVSVVNLLVNSSLRKLGQQQRSTKLQVTVALVLAVVLIVGTFFVERQLAFSHIENAKPTYSKLENGSYYDLTNGEWVKRK